MPASHEQTFSVSFSPERPPLPASLAGALLRRLIGKLDCGELAVRTPAGGRLVFQGQSPGPLGEININSWRLLARLARDGDLGFAESYMAGEWSSPNLASLLKLASLNLAGLRPVKGPGVPRFLTMLRHAMNRNTKQGARRNIAAHYDLGNGFFKLWLDAGMTYSAALFSSESQTLEEAQNAKLDRVLELLDLGGGEKVLEIGSGWGSFAERLLSRHKGSTTSITLSGEQLAFARQRLHSEVLSGRCDLRLQDYRDVRGIFDRIVSIEMLEAVGEAYWSLYFAKLHEALRPGGIAILQAITIGDDRFETYRRRPDFIQKYIFPGGMLLARHIVEREAAKAGLRLVA